MEQQNNDNFNYCEDFVKSCWAPSQEADTLWGFNDFSDDDYSEE